MMKGRLSALLLAAAALAAPALFADDEVLFWMVDSSSSVTTAEGETTDIKTFFSSVADQFPEGSDFSARVRVTGGGVAADTFLKLYLDDELVDGDLGMAFGDVGGSWGSGVPTGNISPLGDFATSSPEYSFVVEIGNVVWSDGGEDGAWTTLATGAAATYASLGDYIGQIGALGVPQGPVWTSTHFDAVPEPTGSLLVLLGAALLTLRRRRPAAR